MIIKNLCLLFFLLCISFKSFSQFGVSYHQSSIPFAGVNYQFNERIISELRIDVNNYIEDMGVELTGSYIFSKKDAMQPYAGIGVRVNAFEGLVVPVGMNFFPFESKNFGFHAELAPLLSFHESFDVLRGSWGIRYRFRQQSGSKTGTNT